MSGAERIARERERQISVEGWTPQHDDTHDGGELAWAAVCYAAPQRVFRCNETDAGIEMVDPWPWDGMWDKRVFERHEPSGLSQMVAPSQSRRIDLLTKAGALIAAEIDRLQRAAECGGATNA